MGTKLIPYLYFNGTCRQAMEFYHAALGGELQLMEVKDTPAAGQFPTESAHLIMHGELHSGDVVIMASDDLRGSTKGGDQIALMVNCESEAEIHALANALSKGGTVDQPVRKEFWGDFYGQVTDPFGIHWQMNYHPQA